VRFAALAAPAVDRAFIAGMRAGGLAGKELVRSYGSQAVGYLIDLRNPLAAGRAVTEPELAAVYRYTDPAKVRASIQRSLDHGLLDRSGAGSIAATGRGRAFLADLFALHGQVLDKRWQPHRERVARLNALLARLLTAAAATAGPAWAVQAPPYEPDGTPANVRLLNRLGTLRYHRSDAHAAAWQAAGLTAAGIIAAPAGPQRAAIEQATDERAAPPYAELTAGERLSLLADLAALP
jgi:hypothetical protein